MMDNQTPSFVFTSAKLRIYWMLEFCF